MSEHEQIHRGKIFLVLTLLANVVPSLLFDWYWNGVFGWRTDALVFGSTLALGVLALLGARWARWVIAMLLFWRGARCTWMMVEIWTLLPAISGWCAMLALSNMVPAAVLALSPSIARYQASRDAYSCGFNAALGPRAR